MSVSAYTYMQRCAYFCYALQQELLEWVLFLAWHGRKEQTNDKVDPCINTFIANGGELFLLHPNHLFILTLDLPGWSALFHEPLCDGNGLAVLGVALVLRWTITSEVLVWGREMCIVSYKSQQLPESVMRKKERREQVDDNGQDTESQMGIVITCLWS